MGLDIRKEKKIEVADFEDEFLPNHLLWSGNLRPLEACISVLRLTRGSISPWP